MMYHSTTIEDLFKRLCSTLTIISDLIEILKCPPMGPNYQRTMILQNPDSTEKSLDDFPDGG